MLTWWDYKLGLVEFGSFSRAFRKFELKFFLPSAGSQSLTDSEAAGAVPVFTAPLHAPLWIKKKKGDMYTYLYVYVYIHIYIKYNISSVQREPK